MKIVKTKEITAKNVSEIPDADGECAIFKEREYLHKDAPHFFVYILDEAWNAFISHGNNAYKESRHEAQGIFVGHFYEDRMGTFAVATKYEEGYGISQSAYVEMSDKCLAEISNRCQNDNTLMLVWVHTHPGFSAWYSSTDNNNLKTNFYKPFQIGIVVDTVNRQHKGYKIEDANVVAFSDYKLFDKQRKNFFLPYENIEKKPRRANRKKATTAKEQNSDTQKMKATIKKLDSDVRVDEPVKSEQELEQGENRVHEKVQIQNPTKPNTGSIDIFA